MEILIAVIQLFVITDPLGNLPIFHMLTKDKKIEERRKTYLAATVFGFTILVVFALLGTYILQLFNITLSDFRIAGGILLLILSVLILVRGNWLEVKSDDRIIGAVPLGCPIIAGPGAITTSMVLMGSFGLRITITAILIASLINIVILLLGDTIFKYLGENGSEIISRIMAIFLAAIGVHYIIVGISHVFLLNIR